MEYKDWRNGDKLKVLEVAKGDPFYEGETVTHVDEDGATCPYVVGERGVVYAMCNFQLEVIRAQQ